MLPLLITLIAPVAAVIFGLLEYTPWVVLIQALGIVCYSFPFREAIAHYRKDPAVVAALALFGVQILGNLLKFGIPYALGRGIRAILS